MPGRLKFAPTATLLLAIAVVAVSALSIAGCGAGMTPEQKEAMKKVHFLGGKLSFKDGGYKIDFSQTPVEDKDLEILAHVGKITSLDLRGTRVTDGCLKHLEPLQSLETIVLQRTGVTKEAVQNLRKMLPKADVVY